MLLKSQKVILIGLGLLLLSVFVLIGNWHRIKTQPDSFSGQDEEHHFLRGLLVYDSFRSDDGKLFNESQVDWHPRWPPLVYVSSAALMELFGRSQQVMTMVGSVYFIVLIFAVFGIGSFLRSPAHGLMAGALVTTFPYLFKFSKYYNLDIPLAACSALVIFFFLLSKNLTRFWPGAALGLCFGLGLLTKIIFPIFVVPAIIAGMVINSKNNNKWKINLLVASLIGALVSSFWYLPRLPDIMSDLWAHLVDYNKGIGAFQAETGGFFLSQTIQELGIVSSLVIFLALFHFPINEKQKLLPIWVWLVFPLIVFSFAPSDLARFAIPSISAAVLLIAIIKTGKAGRWIRYTFLALVFALHLNSTITLATEKESWLFLHSEEAGKEKNSPWRLMENAMGAIDVSYWNKVCVFQEIFPKKICAEHLQFMILKKHPRSKVQIVSLFNNTDDDYIRLKKCMENPGVVIYWTDNPAKDWPDKESVARVGKYDPSVPTIDGRGVLRPENVEKLLALGDLPEKSPEIISGYTGSVDFPFTDGIENVIHFYFKKE